MQYFLTDSGKIRVGALSPIIKIKDFAENYRRRFSEI